MVRSDRTSTARLPTPGIIRSTRPTRPSRGNQAMLRRVDPDRHCGERLEPGRPGAAAAADGAAAAT